MTEKPKSGSWLIRFTFNVLLPLSFLLVMALFLSWLFARQNAKDAEDQRQELAASMALTSRGCPAARTIIREISSDGTYSRHEIEVLDALVKAEQAKPGGLSACRAPSWRWSLGGWVVSKEYAE